MKCVVAVLIALIVSGCGGEIVKTETAVKVVEVAPPPPPALPRECKPEAMRTAEPIKKIAGNKTPDTAVDHALVTNIKRLNENLITQKSCYCTVSEWATEKDREAAKAVCPQRPEALPMPTSIPKKEKTS